MTSPITAVVSHAAAQTTQPQHGSTAKGEPAQGHVSPQELARVSSVAAERRSNQTSEEKRVIKRHEARAEAGYSPQKSPPQNAKQPQPAEEEQGEEQKSDRLVDLEA